MITPSDPEYISTKQIKRGESAMEKLFVPLAKWIDETYGVKTMNIVYDTIDNGQRPRLQIIFEYNRDLVIFNASYGYNKEKQNEIGSQFKALLDKQNETRYSADNIWVIYSAFEPISRWETSDSISSSEIDALKVKLNNNELWEISNQYGGVTFFLYTDKQKDHYENSEVKRQWTAEYFTLLKRYDEFDYFSKENYTISLDSKENFDQLCRKLVLLLQVNLLSKTYVRTIQEYIST